MLHRIPTGKNRRRTEQWLVALGLDLTTTVDSIRKWRVCSEHFVDADYVETLDRVTRLKVRHLKDTAVPSVFPPVSQNQSAPDAVSMFYIYFKPT